MRPLGSSYQLEKRRRRAIALLRSGKPYRWVAQRLKSSLSSVVRWWQAHQKGGPKALRSKPTPGRLSGLSESQKKKLCALLLAGSRKAGYTTDLWTLKRIASLIGKHFGVSYGATGVWRLLVHDLGWSCQKPERRAIQRDEEYIAHWKKAVWPRIKKRPRTWRPSGFPR